jgi:type II secretory pathway pseudopilin PulG
MRNGNGFSLIRLLIAVVVFGSLAAFAIPTLGGRKEKALLAGMQSDLRRLVRAQEAFYRDNQTYARAIGPTQGATTVAFEPSGDNVITLSSVSAAGWAAQMTNAELKGSITRCGIFIGSATVPNAAVTTDGVPACY